MRSKDIEIGVAYTIANSLKEVENDPRDLAPFKVISKPDGCKVEVEGNLAYFERRGHASRMPNGNYSIATRYIIETTEATETRLAAFLKERERKKAWFADADILKARFDATGLATVSMPMPNDYKNGWLRLVVPADKLEAVLALLEGSEAPPAA